MLLYEELQKILYKEVITRKIQVSVVKNTFRTFYNKKPISITTVQFYKLTNEIIKMTKTNNST